MANYTPPSPLYIPLQGIQTAFINKDDGTELAGGYIKFFRDAARTAPKDVFVQAQQPDNSYQFITVGNIITLSSVGTTQNPNDGTDAQIYLFPWTGVENFPGDVDLYYFSVYSSDNILQFTREAQPPNVVGSSNPATSFQDSDNQIENPQFVETLFPNSSSNLFTVTGTSIVTPIAPDWSIVTSGTGSVMVTQENIEDSTIASGAPFSIHLLPAGITSLKLRQTISNSPRIMGNNYVSGSLVAKTYTAQPTQLIMDYVPSTGQTVNLVSAFTTADGQYSVLMNSNASLIATSNNDGGLSGFVNIDITIPATSEVAITSVQFVSVEN